jgi:serine/threonine-protein kinase
MLMGRRLFTAPNDLDVLLMVRDARIERLAKYARDLPPALDRIVRRALKKDPRERYPTAAAFRDALADYLYETRQRVGPPDLRAFVGDLLDGGPEAMERLLAQANRAGAPAARKNGAPAAADPNDRTNPDSAPRGASTHADDSPWMNEIPDAPPVTRADQIASPAELAAMDAQTTQLPAPVPTALDVWPGQSEREEEEERSSARGFTPIQANRVPIVPVGPLSEDARREVGRFVSGAPERPPDSAGDISVIAPMRLFCDLAVAGETGLLRFEVPGTVKEIFLVKGAPESVNSSLPTERFGEYLVAKEVLGRSDLDLALSMLPRYNGKLGDTLVALGLLRPLDVFRLLSQQVRDRVIEVFCWTEGTFAFFRGATNPNDSFPLGLDTFEILGAGVVELPTELLDQKFAPLVDYTPVATNHVRVQPEAFRIGPTPREVLEMLDGGRTLRAWLDTFPEPEERLTFMRSLYLLVETDLAQLD